MKWPKNHSKEKQCKGHRNGIILPPVIVVWMFTTWWFDWETGYTVDAYDTVAIATANWAPRVIPPLNLYDLIIAMAMQMIPTTADWEPASPTSSKTRTTRTLWKRTAPISRKPIKQPSTIKALCLIPWCGMLAATTAEWVTKPAFKPLVSFFNLTRITPTTPVTPITSIPFMLIRQNTRKDAQRKATKIRCPHCRHSPSRQSQS